MQLSVLVPLTLTLETPNPNAPLIVDRHLLIEASQAPYHHQADDRVDPGERSILRCLC